MRSRTSTARVLGALVGWGVLVACVASGCGEPGGATRDDPRASVDGPAVELAREVPRAAPPSVVHPMRLVRRLPLVDVVLPGGRAGSMVVDTGAGSPIVLDLALARELGLPVVGTTRVLSQGTLVEARVVELRSLLLGGVELGPIRGVACDLSAFRPLFGAGYAGVLGFPLFAGRQLVIDYPARAIELGAAGDQPADGQLAIDYQLLDETPVITCRVGDWEVPLTVDTGLSFGLLLPERFASRLAWRAPLAAGPSSMGVGGVDTHHTAVLDGPLVLAAQRIDRPTVILGKGLIGLLGGEVLERFRVSFDTDRRTVGFALPAPR